MKFQTSTQEKKQFEICIVPTGIYLAKFVEEKSLPDHKEYGPQTALIFEFESDGKKYRLPYKVYTKYPASKKNKLGKVVIAFNQKIEDGEFDTNEKIGSSVNIYVKDYDKVITKDGKQSTIKASYIEDLIPIINKV